MKTRYIFVKYLLLGSLFITTALMGGGKPNFVVIFIDDMGYGDIEPFGSTRNKTPNLSRMAAEGKTFTSFYVASPVCTASRAALMTASYPQRVGLEKGSGHIVLFPGDPHGLNPAEITIAETLKSGGYATGCFGKWHLGDQAALCRRFTEAAIGFIRVNKEKPFFLYLPHAFVHTPRMASAAFMGKGKTVEQAQVEEVDWSVGQILKALQEEGIAENTLVLFTSDNGPAKGLSPGPLRGSKSSAFEGGHREPTIAWWPGTIPAGTSCDELATAMDIYPTFSRMAGVSMPGDRVIDGKDIAPLLLGKQGAKTPHDRFFYQQEGKLAAVRSGDWKLFTNGELYNLRTDLSETVNVAQNHPEVVLRQRAMLHEFEAEVKRNARPVGLVRNSRTLLPRPGIAGPEGYVPTLTLPHNP